MNLTRFLLYEIKKNLGIALYLKPQNFKIIYFCKVKNLLPSKNQLTIIFPAPPNFRNQKVNKILATPKNFTNGEEKTHKNSFIYWKANLKPRENKTFKLEFEVEILPAEFSTYDQPNGKIYTRSEKHVDFKDPRIQRIAAKLNPPKGDVLKIAQYLNDVVINMLSYGKPIEDLYSSVESLSSKQTDCGGFSTLLSALLRYCKIPARIVSGYLLSADNSVMHAWVEFMLPNGKWIPADPTIENLQKKQGSKRSGKFGCVGSDHLVLSYGSDMKLDISGKPITVDILQNPYVDSSNGPKSTKIQSQLIAKIIK